VRVADSGVDGVMGVDGEKSPGRGGAGLREVGEIGVGMSSTGEITGECK